MRDYIFDLDENLEWEIQKYYVTQGISRCIHLKIAVDKRDNSYKCTKCFTKFIMNEKRVKKFKSRIVLYFDFKDEEKRFISEIKKIKKEEKE
ncbi:hypothetical protein [Spiroplasma taiwanense]|uniref:Uncharacterized protein n=1 Tax=Spiroplasma taiwanense CT-1 TaxID=1276220 RepID=S5LX81_9MOLU|nr:hypothetical protein [Spiroplasma taiwanense]AGR41231.1 hypothetical protein STAIW_v1c06090 [Spiroplasma taiwanense CT-1]